MPGFGRYDLTTWIRLALRAEPEQNLSDDIRKTRRLMRGRISQAELDRRAMEDFYAQARSIDGVSQEVKPTFDIFGSYMHREQISEVATGVAGALTVSGTATPQGRIRRVAAASLEHTDVTNRYIFIAQCDPRASIETALTEAHQAAGGTREDQRPAVLQRPIFLPPGWFLRGRCRAAITGTAQLILTFAFLELPLGEYAVSP